MPKHLLCISHLTINQNPSISPLPQTQGDAR